MANRCHSLVRCAFADISSEHGADTRNCQVAIFRSAGQRVAVHVDEVLGNGGRRQEPGVPRYVALPGLTGMSILAGAVVLIYNPVTLAIVYGDQSAANYAVCERHCPCSRQKLAGIAEPLASTGKNQIHFVLVVDDSITVRRVPSVCYCVRATGWPWLRMACRRWNDCRKKSRRWVLSDIEVPAWTS